MTLPGPSLKHLENTWVATDWTVWMRKSEAPDTHLGTIRLLTNGEEYVL